jgi:Zn-dependent M16 (insulinase) family peptidase
MRRVTSTVRRVGQRTGVRHSSFAVGQTLHGYRVLRVAAVPEKALDCVILEHEASGARHLHVEAKDSNNVFCVTFVTVPKDDTGVAHILEHTVL